MVAALGVFAFADGVARSEESASLEIGMSAQGRPLGLTCFNTGSSADDEVVLLVGGMHTGSESVTAELARALIVDFERGRLAPPEGVTACVLPELNPDGIALGVHTNANEVDLNRNWPSHDWTKDAWHPETGPVSGGRRPLSEPETQGLHSFLELVRPSAVLVFHCCGSLVEANRQADAVFMARRYARATDFEYLDTWDYYDISGEFIDSMDELDVPAMDIELRSSSDPAVEEHRAGVRAALDYIAERPKR